MNKKEDLFRSVSTLSEAAPPAALCLTLKSVVTLIGTFYFIIFCRGKDDDDKVNKKQVYLKMQ